MVIQLFPLFDCIKKKKKCFVCFRSLFRTLAANAGSDLFLQSQLTCYPFDLTHPTHFISLLIYLMCKCVDEVLIVIVESGGGGRKTDNDCYTQPAIFPQ